MENEYQELLSYYKEIWNSRNMQSEEKEAAVILKEAVLRELKDENSHPRVRRNKEVKYYFAIKRITESHLPIEAKYKLIEYYTIQMEELRK